MKTTRRGTMLALFTGALAVLGSVAARKGLPGAQAAARRLARPGLPQANIEMYGYREVDVS